jgi:alpha-amylase/alpha-mannosidase (GH57 family)
MPWVRVRDQDYLDMATTVAQYPDVHVTFNITPSLIRQLDDSKVRPVLSAHREERRR